MEELRIFISDLLDTLGLGIGGNINSYKYDKAKELFNKYTISVMGSTAYFAKEGRLIIAIEYDTTEKGVIKGYKFKE